MHVALFCEGCDDGRQTNPLEDSCDGVGKK